MKVRNVEIEAKFVVGVEPDDMNHTGLRVNNAPVWGVDVPWGEGDMLHPDSIKEGDRVRLEIPSGYWEGEATRVGYEEYPDGWENWYKGSGEITVVLAGATWEGKADGLTGGLSGVGTFRVLPPGGVVVESSAIEQPVPYEVYEEVRRVAEFANADVVDVYDTRKKAERMRDILRILGYGEE